MTAASRKTTIPQLSTPQINGVIDTSAQQLQLKAEANWSPATARKTAPPLTEMHP